MKQYTRLFIAVALLFALAAWRPTAQAKTKPSVSAESAVVMDVQSGTILYEKNMDKKEYPASIR